MHRATRRAALRVLAGAAGVATAGCLDDSLDGDVAGTDGDGAEADGEGMGTGGDGAGTDGDDATPDDAARTGEDDAVVWSREPGGRVATVRDGVLYGIEAPLEGSGGLVALDAERGDLAWTYGESGPLSTFTAPAVDDAVYVGYGDDVIGSGSGVLHAIALDGTARWRADTGSVYHRPRLVEGAVVVGSDDGTVAAYDREDGEVRWSVAAAEDASTTDPRVEAVADGVAYVALDGALVALDVADGEERWSYPTGDGWISSLSVADGIYLTTGGAVAAVDRADGTERWRVELDSNKRLLGVADGTVFVRRGYDVLAFDAADGTERWRDESATERRAHVGVDAVYVGADALRALTLDGAPAWSTELDGSAIAAVRSVADGIYVATEDALHRVAPSGERAASAALADVRSLVVADRVYAGTHEAFYAVDLA